MACFASMGRNAACCSGVPQRRRALVTRVLCTSTTTATAASTRDSSSIARHDMKKAAAGAAVRFRDFDAHQAEVEQLGKQGGLEAPVFIHRGHKGGDCLFGKVAHRRAKEIFLLLQHGQGRDRPGVRGRHTDLQEINWGDCFGRPDSTRNHLAFLGHAQGPGSPFARPLIGQAILRRASRCDSEPGGLQVE